MGQQGIEARDGWGWRRGLVEACHVGMMGVWLGAVVMTGAAAARIFPIVKELDPHLTKYGEYKGEHWLIVAGKVANSIFFWAGAVQIVCAVVVVATLVGATMLVRRPVMMLAARWASVLLVLACLGYNVVVLRPRMSRNIEAYWSNAEAGKNQEAAAFQAAFDADHPVATRVFGLTAAALLLSIAVTGWAWGRGAKEEQAEVGETNEQAAG